MLQPKEVLSELQIQQHIREAGLASLLRRLFFKKQPELARELGLNEGELGELLHGRFDLTPEFTQTLARVLRCKPDTFHV